MRRLPLTVLAAALGLAGSITTTTGAGAASTPLCFGRVPTVVLTNGDDQYTTQESESEVIWAGGGNDSITSLGESGHTGIPHPGDYICGGPGNDDLYGDAGPDHINGGDGADDVEGWRGADVLRGNAGDDRVTDMPIDSNLPSDKDILRGGPGNDGLVSGFGPDRVYGQGGGDDISDLECDPSYLSGGPGGDYIESYQDSYGIFGATCDTTTTDSPADTAIGGKGYDRALLSHADTTTGIERVRRAAPQE